MYSTCVSNSEKRSKLYTMIFFINPCILVDSRPSIIILSFRFYSSETLGMYPYSMSDLRVLWIVWANSSTMVILLSKAIKLIFARTLITRYFKYVSWNTLCSFYNYNFNRTDSEMCALFLSFLYLATLSLFIWSKILLAEPLLPSNVLRFLMTNFNKQSICNWSLMTISTSLWLNSIERQFHEWNGTIANSVGDIELKCLRSIQKRELIPPNTIA